MLRWWVRGSPERSVRAHRRLARYTFGAWAYDVASLEWPVYRPGRLAGIELLGLEPGDRVLDVGCGTGLNFAYLGAAIGPSGTIVGVDLSGQMLARANARVKRHGWNNVNLVRADAGTCDFAKLSADGGFDAVLFTFSLSIIDNGHAAWHHALDATRPDGRLTVVDLAVPSDRWAVLAPLARLVCFTGGVDLRRRPWQWVARDTDQVDQRVLRGGHLRVAAGTPARAS